MDPLCGGTLCGGTLCGGTLCGGTGREQEPAAEDVTPSPCPSRVDAFDRDAGVLPDAEPGVAVH